MFSSAEALRNRPSAIHLFQGMRKDSLGGHAFGTASPELWLFQGLSNLLRVGVGQARWLGVGGCLAR